jgi:hypothetical protein
MNEDVLMDEQARSIRDFFEANRAAGFKLFKMSSVKNVGQELADFRALTAGVLAGITEGIENELTTLNARKELLEEELYKYKAAADLMLKQMTNEQN